MDMDICANIINAIPVTSDMYDHLFSWTHIYAIYAIPAYYKILSAVPYMSIYGKPTDDTPFSLGMDLL
jgi:hypothetical protein